MTHKHETSWRSDALEAFTRFKVRCFWHCPHDMEVSIDTLPTILNGLRKYGGREGFVLASQIERKATKEKRKETP